MCVYCVCVSLWKRGVCVFIIEKGWGYVCVGAMAEMEYLEME